METDRLFKVFQEHPVVTTDSRDCPEGSVFFALKGASFNGNRFAMNAIEQGCAYAVVDEAAYAVDERFILVDDCLRALQLLAREHRRQFAIPVIGIGAGAQTDGQILVWQDLLGLNIGHVPKFARTFANLGETIQGALRAYAGEVAAHTFPAEAESYQ